MEKYIKVITGHFILKKNSLKIKIVQKPSLHYLLVCTYQNAVVILGYIPLRTIDKYSTTTDFENLT